ncbi:brain and acute leukemia cytoplasmic protein isoform X3 [Manis javanica]|uniref:brain and acute leukemia cytoplasmic protein isoform X3 n=1 Tax=Manis javanica TaxID=9974 RepID=UPI00187AAB8E|nr:brain and acute leukemia cytoplasmic protein isoform X6 [Manis javanica]
MGCGGSRADAIEPRYYESWTRETESTWLTYTDSDSPPSAAAADSGAEAGGLHAGGHEGFSTTATELRAASILFQHRGWALSMRLAPSENPQMLKEMLSECLQKKSPLMLRTASDRWTGVEESQRTASTS